MSKGKALSIAQDALSQCITSAEMVPELRQQVEAAYETVTGAMRETAMSERDELVNLLEVVRNRLHCGHAPTDIITSIEDGLADYRNSLTAQQESVARVKRNDGCKGREFIGESLDFRDLPVGTKLYTAPPSGVREGMLRAAEICLDQQTDRPSEMNFMALRCRDAITRAAEQINAEEREQVSAVQSSVPGVAPAPSAPPSNQPQTVSVPVEPTLEILDAGVKELEWRGGYKTHRHVMEIVWRAMLRAATGKADHE